MNPVKHTREIGTLKTFYVQKYNDEGELLDRFEKYSMHDQNEFSSFLKRVEGKGLESICASDEVPNVITSLRDINTENYYRISASHLTVIRKGITWSQIEDQAMEMETLLAVEKALRENIRTPSLKIFNKRILFDSKKNPIFEVDGIIICDDTALLIESKHNMLKKHIESLTERLGEFPEKLKIATESDPEFLKLLEKSYVGVVCGTKFPEELRDLSKIRGFIVVFPGGNRYKVEIPEELSKYWQL